LAVQTATLLLIPKVDKRIADIEYANYNIPTLAYGERVLIQRDRVGGIGADAYVYTEDDYVDGRVEETYNEPVVTLRTIDDAKQVLRLAKLNALLQQLINDKTATAGQLRAALTLDEYNEYVSSLTTVKELSEINYGICVRYGSKVLELAKGKYAIEVGVEKDLVNVLEVVKTAVLNGELDAAIDNAANKLRDGFGK
jgi:hypothetical protein